MFVRIVQELLTRALCVSIAVGLLVLALDAHGGRSSAGQSQSDVLRVGETVEFQGVLCSSVQAADALFSERASPKGHACWHGWMAITAVKFIKRYHVKGATFNLVLVEVVESGARLYIATTIPVVEGIHT